MCPTLITKTAFAVVLLSSSLQAFSIENEGITPEPVDTYDFAEDFYVIQADNDIQLRRMKKLVSSDELDSNMFLKKVEKMRIKLDSKS
jgi:hypothetical protein